MFLCFIGNKRANCCATTVETSLHIALYIKATILRSRMGYPPQASTRADQQSRIRISKAASDAATGDLALLNIQIQNNARAPAEVEVALYATQWPTLGSIPRGHVRLTKFCIYIGFAFLLPDSSTWATSGGRRGRCGCPQWVCLSFA